MYFIAASYTTVQECDATGDAICTKAGYIKITSPDFFGADKKIAPELFSHHVQSFIYQASDKFAFCGTNVAGMFVMNAAIYTRHAGFNCSVSNGSEGAWRNTKLCF